MWYQQYFLQWAQLALLFSPSCTLSQVLLLLLLQLYKAHGCVSAMLCLASLITVSANLLHKEAAL